MTNLKTFDGTVGKIIKEWSADTCSFGKVIFIFTDDSYVILEPFKDNLTDCFEINICDDFEGEELKRHFYIKELRA